MRPGRGGRRRARGARGAACGACLGALLALPVAASVPPGLLISTFDADGAALGGNRLEWWLDDGQRRKHIVECAGVTCSTWELPTTAAASAAIHVVLLRNREPGCWDEHRGRVAQLRGIAGTVDHSRKRSVTLRYVSTLCS